MANEVRPRARSGWPTIAVVVASLCLPLVALLSVAGFLVAPGDEPVGTVVAGALLAVASVTVSHIAGWRLRRRNGHRSTRVLIAVVLSYVALLLSATASAFPRARFMFATWRTPPNYELTLELQGSERHPVTTTMVEQFKTRLSLRLMRLIIPHVFLPDQPPRMILRLWVPEGSDMSRPFDSRILTISLVHDQTDVLLAGASHDVRPPDGWKVVARGTTRFIVTSEPLLVDDVHDARVTAHNGRFGVLVEFGPQSAERLRRAMQEFAGRRVAVLLDDQPYIAPRLEGKLPPGGELLIGADLELAEANDLALVLRSGMLPVPLRIIEGHYLK